MSIEMENQSMKPNRKVITTWIAILILSICSSAKAVEKSENADRARDEAVIKEKVKMMESGWNTKSGALFAKPFAEDADFVVINGMHVQTRAVIERNHQRIFDTILKNTSLTLSVKQMRFLKPDVAVVHVTGHRTPAPGENAKGVGVILTLVMTKEKGNWQIVAFQNTEIQGAQQR
jgi:uncharacterized protein (TIGR02246 family)